MSKNYYEILQVSQNASPEIIEKAYKTLAKKYHPDIQKNSNKQQAENLMKEINEAYEILSDPKKRESYDQSLLENNFSIEEIENLYNENKNLKNELNNLRNNTQNYNNQQQTRNKETNNFNNNPETQHEQKIQQAVNQAYYDAYIQDMKNRGYKIKHKKTFKQHLESFISAVITIIVIFIIFQIPFVKNFFTNLYNENNAFKMIIDFVVSIFSAFFSLFNFSK